MFSDKKETPVVEKTRKKRRNKTAWKREAAKTARHKAKLLPRKPNCIHRTKGKSLNCERLTMQQIRRFHEAFYSTTNKVEQDNYILRYTDRNIPKRARGSKGKNRTVCIKYFVPTREGRMEVCAKAFLQILNISKFRVQNLNRKYPDGHAKETRGGDRRLALYRARREAVEGFIRRLNFVESHYTRNSSQRQYMPCGYSLRKLWADYNSTIDNNLKVQYNYFRGIFNYNFNISFKTPSTDACSECIRLKNEISRSMGVEKNNLMAKLTVHKMKAKCFYSFLKDEDDPTVLKLSFDCEKNLVLPKVPDQAAYFSRQLYNYNFTVCHGNSLATQNPETVFIYSWQENQRNKGSNEIASFIYHHLNNAVLTGKTEIKLFCDGCPGQNKNTTVLGMLCYWLSTDQAKDVNTINIMFPVVGHSFMPPDRVFGRIEKIIKRSECIIQPEEYEAIFSNFGTVRKLPSVLVYDWKKALSSIIKPPGQLHFKFNPTKRLTIKKIRNKITVKGEVHYRSDLGEFKSILKKGKNFRNVSLELLPIGIPLKKEKLKDVDALLKKHFGEDWRGISNLEYYRRTLDEAFTAGTYNEEHEEEEDIIEEDEELRI